MLVYVCLINYEILCIPKIILSYISSLCISKYLIIYLHVYTQTHIKGSDSRSSREGNKFTKTYHKTSNQREIVLDYRVAP